MTQKNKEPHFFSPCDVARIADNCVKDTGAEPLEVLFCVAKKLGFSFIATYSGLDFEKLGTGVGVFSDVISTEFYDDRKLPGKKRVRNFKKMLSRIRGSIFRAVGWVAEMFGLETMVVAFLEVATGLDMMYESKVDVDIATEEDKKKRRICDCDKKGRSDDWKNQKRNPDGTFA